VTTIELDRTGPAGKRRLGRTTGWMRRALSTTSARVGAVLVVLVVGIAMIGPFFAPHDPAALVGVPFASPGNDGLLLGSDYLGRDALSRFLWGGRTLLGVALAATLLSYLAGVTLGLIAAFRQGFADTVLTASLDVLLAFPPLLFVLLLLTTGVHSVWLVALAVSLIFAPRVARIVRGAALDIALREFVEAAVARGEGLRWILFQEVLPNLWPALLADIGIRFTASIIVIASVGFLGFGQQPPAADWGLMIGENRSGILIQPWVVIAPVVAIAVLTVGVNLVGDGVVKVLGRSDVVEASRRDAR
jgi:peptide/nickel transport system permease protein